MGDVIHTNVFQGAAQLDDLAQMVTACSPVSGREPRFIEVNLPGDIAVSVGLWPGAEYSQVRGALAQAMLQAGGALSGEDVTCSHISIHFCGAVLPADSDVRLLDYYDAHSDRTSMAQFLELPEGEQSPVQAKKSPGPVLSTGMSVHHQRLYLELSMALFRQSRQDDAPSVPVF